MATTQHRPHSAFAGPLYGALDGKTEDTTPTVVVLTQHRPHGAFAGVLYGTLSGKTPAGGSAPADPTTVVGTPTGSTTATTTWAHSGGGETGFAVQRAPTATGVYADGTGATNPTAAGVYTYAHTGLTAATEYTSRVKANGTPDSAWAVSAPWTTDTPGGGGGGIPTMIDCGVGTAVASGLPCAITATTVIACGVGVAVASGLGCSITAGGAADTGGGWAYVPIPKRRTRKELLEERVALGILPAEVVAELPAPVIKQARKVGTIRAVDLFGKSEAAAMSTLDLEIAIQRIKRTKRRRQDEELLLM